MHNDYFSFNNTYIWSTKKLSTIYSHYSLADGYEHRILFGLAQHQNPKVFQLTFNVSETEADTIETFLDARANDNESFDFATDYLPGETASSFRFVCENWSKSIPYKNRATIQATFRQVFEPAS